MQKKIAFMTSIFLVMVCSLTAECKEKKDFNKEQIILNNQAVEASMREDYKTAELLYQANLRMGEFDITWLNLGRTYAKQNMCIEAAEAYANVATAPKTSKSAAMNIDTTLLVYEKELSEQCSAPVAFECVSDKMTFSVDNGKDYPCDGRVYNISPGEHLFTGKMPDGSSVQVSKTVVQSKLTMVELLKPGNAVVVPLAIAQPVATQPVEVPPVDIPSTVVQPTTPENEQNSPVVVASTPNPENLPSSGSGTDTGTVSVSTDRSPDVGVQEDWKKKSRTFKIAGYTLLGVGVVAGAVAGGLQLKNYNSVGGVVHDPGSWELTAQNIYLGVGIAGAVLAVTGVALVIVDHVKYGNRTDSDASVSLNNDISRPAVLPSIYLSGDGGGLMFNTRF